MARKGIPGARDRVDEPRLVHESEPPTAPDVRDGLATDHKAAFLRKMAPSRRTPPGAGGKGHETLDTKHRTSLGSTTLYINGH
jgi:hypothetical protein